LSSVPDGHTLNEYITQIETRLELWESDETNLSNRIPVEVKPKSKEQRPIEVKPVLKTDSKEEEVEIFAVEQRNDSPLCLQCKASDHIPGSKLRLGRLESGATRKKWFCLVHYHTQYQVPKQLFKIKDYATLSKELQKELQECRDGKKVPLPILLNKEPEITVKKICEKRFNKKKNREEWKTEWSDGSIPSWEAAEQFVDDDGTVNASWKAFEDVSIKTTEAEDSETAENTPTCFCKPPQPASLQFCSAKKNKHHGQQFFRCAKSRKRGIPNTAQYNPIQPNTI